MEIRITYRSEIYIKGENLEDIKRKWESIDIEPDLSQEKDVTGFDFIEIVSAEDGDFNDLTEEFDS